MRRTLFLAAALVLGAACSDGTTSAGASGHTKVLLTDDPFSFDSIARVDIYIKEISASASLDTTGLTPQNWVTIAQPGKVFNLLDLQQGTTALAGEVDLPAGQYRAIRVTINTGLSHVIRKDGSEASVQWPVPGDLKLYAYVENPLDVPVGGAQIVIDFDVGRTFMDNGSGGFWFIPWIRAVNDAETGSIGGTVKGPGIEGDSVGVPGAEVMVMTSPGFGAMPAIVTTTRTDAQGRYLVGYVKAGDYNLGVQPPRQYVFNTGIVGASVMVGQRSTVNFWLTRSTGTDTTGTGGGGGGNPDSTGTGGGAGTGPVMGIAVQPATQTVNVGDSVPVMANLLNAQGQTLTGRTVTWTSSDSTRVYVFGSFANWAVLRATHSGSVTIYATSEGKTAAGTVVVR